MRKNLLFFVGLLLTLSVNAEAHKPMLGQMSYTIISDEYSKDVPAGKCLVRGVVASNYEIDNNGSPLLIEGAEISTLDRKKTSFTNEKGDFKLLLDSKDTSIFFFKSGYEEILIWNYNFRNQHIVTIHFGPDNNEMMTVPAKPVIYLYSDIKIDTEIQFTCSSNLTFTYPIYNNKWQMVVDANGMTETKTGKKYPYLFWEAEPADINFQIEERTMNGFLINSDTVVNFLESSLTKLGLTEKEQTDFITYWAPKLIAKPFVLIQFLVDDAYAEMISEIAIKPLPDAMRRVFMLFKPLDTNEIGMTIQPQELNSFERKGFTVVEWGGSEMKMSNLIP